MSRFTALIIFVVLLVLVGCFIPFLIGSFVDVSSANHDSAVYPVIAVLTTLFDASHFFLGFLIPGAITDFVHNSYNSFTYLPDWLSVPLMFIMFVSLCYVIITLVPTVGG